MNEDEQRIAIAEACGYFYVTQTDPKTNKNLICHDIFGMVNDFPDYLNDLNAMHEAEKILTNAQRRFYVDMLIKVHPLHYDPQSPTHVDDRIVVFLITNMTSTQRAEAFLRTIGKWKD